MTVLFDKLKSLSTTPSRSDGAFDNWIAQNDTPHFLADDAQQKELILYASLDYVFIQSVVVPSKDIDPLNMSDLQKWELMHDKWGMNYGTEKPQVWLEPPFHMERSKSLRSEEVSVPAKGAAFIKISIV